MSPEDRIRAFETEICAAAYKMRNAAEIDDLEQEGMIAVWLSSPDSDYQFVVTSIYNRMHDWCRFIKRHRHNQGGSYEAIMEKIIEVEENV
jgi:DNA-directed RNA polymerase specialized sigma24 family protein